MKMYEGERSTERRSTRLENIGNENLTRNRVKAEEIFKV